MRQRLWGALACVAWLGAPAIQAQPMPFFQPQALYYELLRALPSLGVTALPSGFEVPGLTAGRINLLKGDGIVGQLAYTEDPLHLASQLEVLDTAGRVLARATETVKPCPPGRCYQATFTTALDEVAGRPAPFAVENGPYSDLTYLRYGTAVNVSVWRFEIDQSLGYLHNLLAKAPTVRLETANPREAALLALARDPVVAPYLAGISIVKVGRQIQLVGTVPSTPAYNLLALAAMRAGLPSYALHIDVLTPNIYPPGYPAGGLLFPQD